MTSRGIFTLTFGPFANCIATHFWNNLYGLEVEQSQNAECQRIASGCFFRVGETRGGQPTYTPRYVSCDLSTNLRTLAESGHIYEQSVSPNLQKSAAWNGNITTAVQEPHQKNEFIQALESDEGIDNETDINLTPDNVESWTDFLRVQIHHKSMMKFTSLEQGVVDNSQRDMYSASDYFSELSSAFRTEDRLGEWEDKVRFFVEDSDVCTCFNVLIDAGSSFAGCIQPALECLRDSFGRSVPVVVTLTDSRPSPLMINKSFPMAMSRHICRELADINFEISPAMFQSPQISWVDSSGYIPSFQFHSSAIASLFLHGVYSAAFSPQFRRIEDTILRTVAPSRRLVHCSGGFRIPLLQTRDENGLMPILPPLLLEKQYNNKLLSNDDSGFFGRMGATASSSSSSSLSSDITGSFISFLGLSSSQCEECSYLSPSLPHRAELHYSSRFPPQNTPFPLCFPRDMNKDHRQSMASLLATGRHMEEVLRRCSNVSRIVKGMESGDARDDADACEQSLEDDADMYSDLR